MSEGRNWGSTVVGWFIVRDDGTPASPVVDVPAATDAGPPPVPTADPAAPAVFKSEPPSAPGGRVDFDGVFTAAGIEAEERDRLTKASALLASLPAETPVPVKKQIVEASLKAFGFPVEKIIERARRRCRRSRSTSGPGQRDTQTLLAESQKRMARTRGGDREHQEA